jgi:hypothetical protein
MFTKDDLADIESVLNSNILDLSRIVGYGRQSAEDHTKMKNKIVRLEQLLEKVKTEYNQKEVNV